MDSTYSRFCPPEQKVQNARLAVLDNFREISRIMTQNFLTHKKLEKRYEKTAIPKSEMERKRLEDEAQQRMTSILKKMHSPANFAAPEVYLPGQKESANSPTKSLQKSWAKSSMYDTKGTDKRTSSPQRHQSQHVRH